MSEQTRRLIRFNPPVTGDPSTVTIPVIVVDTPEISDYTLHDLLQEFKAHYATMDGYEWVAGFEPRNGDVLVKDLEYEIISGIDGKSWIVANVW